MTGLARPRVVHALRTWIHPSETFIHGQVTWDEAFEPVVLARQVKPESGLPTPDRLRVESLEQTSGLARALYRARVLPPAEAARGRRLLDELRPALVHAHFATDARFLLPLLKGRPTPLAISFYGYDAVEFPRRLGGMGARYLRPALERAAAILAPSVDMQRDIELLGVGPERIHVLPWGVDTARFAEVDRSGRSGPTRFGIACRFTAKKGLADLLEAFAQVARETPEVELALAGSGPLEAELRARVAELDLGRLVQFPGFLAAERLPEFLASLDVFVHPSRTSSTGDKEGAPTVIMEAAATGLPVVGTEHAGIPEIVPHATAGLLTAEGDVAGLARHMAALAAQPDLRAELGRNAARHVRAEYDRDLQGRRREALYGRLAATANAGSA